MQYGHFDDENREYVITRPDTPRSWSNYLGSTEYGAIVTNNAGGYSFYKSTARGRFTRLFFNHIPMDQPGRYFYLRDGESGEYWSASWQPVGRPLTEYRSVCRHGTAYTAIESAYAGITSEATYFVPLDRLFECWVLKLTNDSDRPRRLSVFTYVEFTNTWSVAQDTGNLQYSQYLADTRFDGRFICHGTNTNFAEADLADFGEGGAHYVFITGVGADIAGFETDREVFLGPYRTYANPLAVEEGRCPGTEAHGDNGCGVLQFDVALDPGEARELLVLMGLGHAATHGRAALAEMDSPAKARAALEEVKRYWHGRIGSFVAQTPDPELDSMVNVWNAYNSLVTFAWSRSASLVYTGERDGLGYRDTVQDILGVLGAVPDEARQRLELMITGQVSTGGAMPVVRPFEHRPGREAPTPEDEYRSDDCLWLFNTVPAYVKETGDLAFYDKVLPYADQGEATVLGHLRRALEFSLERTGRHGLPCGLRNDWNDCIRLGHTGESIFVAMQVRLGLQAYREAAELLGRPAEAAWACEQVGRLDAALTAHAWDGQWYLRALRGDGTTLGSSRDEEASIFLEPQPWAVISGAATPEQAVQAMDAVRARLFTEYGAAICDPPFQKADIATVPAVLFPPSMKENGGIFCHPQPWVVMAETLLGRGDRAYEYLRAYLPAAYNDRAEERQTEPYVHGQSTHGRHSRRHGATRLPWLTGTVSWTYYVMTQHLLGIRPEYDGLHVDPCIPSAWPGFAATRRFRGATYEIVVRNPDGAQKGVRSLTVDGRPARPDGPLPAAAPGTTVRVEAVMG